jgi:glycosyltransferase involved in cell wall biosynthesis
MWPTRRSLQERDETGFPAERSSSRSVDQPPLVIHVVISFAIGGLEVLVADLARRARRVRTHVICLESMGPLVQKLTGSAATVECIGTPRTPVLESVRTLRRRLTALAPDVLHTHNEKAHIHGALATLGWRRPPIVHTRHGRGQVETSLSWVANRLAVRRSRFLVCVSADAVDVARSEGAHPDQLRVILNAIDVRRYDGSDCPAHSERWDAVTVARLAPVKDLGTMLRAARIIKDAIPGFRLQVVGDGESRQELEQLSQTLGLADTVTFHGASSDPRPYLASARVFLQSSISEGISLTLLEAMASGLPIVATDVGGNREVVDHGRTGYLVPAQDPQALADAAIRVLANPAEAAAMSAAARLRAEERFDLDRMVDEYEALYLEATR